MAVASVRPRPLAHTNPSCPTKAVLVQHIPEQPWSALTISTYSHLDKVTRCKAHQTCLGPTTSAPDDLPGCPLRGVPWDHWPMPTSPSATLPWHPCTKLLENPWSALHWLQLPSQNTTLPQDPLTCTDFSFSSPLTSMQTTRTPLAYTRISFSNPAREPST